MAKIYYEKDADPAVLSGKTVSIIGFGSQGHAHAQNLRDSGVNVVVGEVLDEKNPNFKAAKEAGFEVMTAAEAAQRGDVIVLLVPDTVQKTVYENELKPHLAAGNSARRHGILLVTRWGCGFGAFVLCDVGDNAPAGRGRLTPRRTTAPMAWVGFFTGRAVLGRQPGLHPAPLS